MNIDWKTFSKTLVIVIAIAVVLSHMHVGAFLDGLVTLIPTWGGK